MSDDAGRLAALEAIGDMLAALGVPVGAMLEILTQIEDAAPKHPALRDVARKARGIAARLSDGAS